MLHLRSAWLDTCFCTCFFAFWTSLHGLYGLSGLSSMLLTLSAAQIWWLTGGWQVANMWLTWQVWWLTCLVWWLTCLHPCLSLFMICMCHATGVSHSNAVLTHSTLTQVNVSHPWSALSALLHGWHGAHFWGGKTKKNRLYSYQVCLHTFWYSTLMDLHNALTNCWLTDLSQSAKTSLPWSQYKRARKITYCSFPSDLCQI